MKWLGVASMACFTVSYLPQLIRTYRTRNVQGLSTSYWTIVVLGYATGIPYVLPRQDTLVTMTYVIGGACATAMLAGCLLFRGR